MATDFGDESGEKLFDWVLRIGQDASEQAMLASAERLKDALRNARGEIGGKGPEDAAGQPSEWAKLSMGQFASLPEYRSIKEIIDGKLAGEGIEHAFFEDKGKEHLLFKVEDAPSVSRAFGDLEKQADIALDRALEACGKTREQIRDAQPLEERAASARESAKAMEAARGKAHEVEIAAVRSK